jgi:hypothetical protein
MKRNILDITQKMFRNPASVKLTAMDLSDDIYWIFEAKGWRFIDILREIEYRITQNRLKLHINTQIINANDYLVEQTSTGILIKFIKSKFQYTLDAVDYIEITGDMEQYA